MGQSGKDFSVGQLSSTSEIKGELRSLLYGGESPSPSGRLGCGFRPGLAGSMTDCTHIDASRARRWEYNQKSI